jgi:hypothetical protein
VVAEQVHYLLSPALQCLRNIFVCRYRYGSYSLGINTKYECLQEILDPEHWNKENKKTITDGTAVKILQCILRPMLCQLWSCGLQQNQVHQEGKKWYYTTMQQFISYLLAGLS